MRWMLYFERDVTYAESMRHILELLVGQLWLICSMNQILNHAYETIGKPNGKLNVYVMWFCIAKQKLGDPKSLKPGICPTLGIVKFNVDATICPSIVVLVVAKNVSDLILCFFFLVKYGIPLTPTLPKQPILVRLLSLLASHLFHGRFPHFV